MSRQFRVYGKKRGGRTTGGGRFGNWGLALFFGFFFALGVAALGLILAFLVLPEWRVNNEFVAGRCTVLDKRIAEKTSDDDKVYRPELLIAYAVDGKTRQAWTYDIARAHTSGKEDKQKILDRFETGKEYPCWYDPANPESAVLVRGYTWVLWLILLLPIAFILIGGGGVVYWLFTGSTSIERRSALAKKVTELELFEGHDLRVAYPQVPQGADLVNSPGTQLTYRLPVAQSPGVTAAFLVVSAVLWNAMVAVFVTMAVRSFLDGDSEWLLIFLSVPFTIVGAGLIYAAARQFLIATRVGQTLLEISDHPLRPGKEYEMCVQQAGRLKMKALHVWLVCDERATYQHGTNTRTETCRVARREVLSREGFTITGDKPFEATGRFAVPAEAMHSFKGGRNAIDWKLVVEGDVVNWPNFEREFPVIVYPAAAPEERSR